MYNGSGTVGKIVSGQPVDAAAYATAGGCSGPSRILHMHSPDGSTFLREMMSWPLASKYDVISEIRHRQPTHYLPEKILLNFIPTRFEKTEFRLF